MGKEEVKKENKIKSNFEKVKKADMKKKSRFVIILFFLVAMIFGTITNLGFAKFDFLTWLADMLVLVGIQVFGLIFGELIGGDKFHEGLNGPFQHNLAIYNRQMNENSHVIYRGFSQWYNKKLPEELFNKKVDFLTSQGIGYDNAYLIVRYCDIDDLDSLVRNKATKKHDDEKNKDIYIGGIKEFQVEAVKYVLKGELKLDSPNASYYLTSASDKHGNLSLFELGNAYQRDIKQVRTFSRLVKIVSSTIISAFMAALTVYDLMSSDDVQAWMKLLSRITALFTSLFAGGLSAKETVKIEAKIIKNKAISIGMYLADVKDRMFVPKSREDYLKDVYEKEQAKAEAAKKNVVDPEVLEMEDGKMVKVEKPKMLDNKSHLLK